MDLKTALAEEIAKHAGLTSDEVSQMLETPPDPKLGDAALPCFQLAKVLRKAPPAIAQELSEKIEKITDILCASCIFWRKKRLTPQRKGLAIKIPYRIPIMPIIKTIKNAKPKKLFSQMVSKIVASWKV